jgi:hypothetical protein
MDDDAMQSPATKADIGALMDQIGKLYDANEGWKEEVMRHFDVVAEQIKHDFNGAFSDKVEQHEERLLRLEEHVGLAA